MAAQMAAQTLGRRQAVRHDAQKRGTSSRGRNKVRGRDSLCIVTPDPLAPWHDLYLGTLSASSALTGLLFVAVTLHVRALVGDQLPILRAEARAIYLGYIASATLSMLALIPNQTLRALGIEILAVAAVHAFLLRGSLGESFGRNFASARAMVIRTWVIGGFLIAVRWAAGAGLAFEQDWALAPLLPVSVIGSILLALYLSWDLVFRGARDTTTG